MADDFCPVCDLRLSLHPEVSTWGCDIAAQKAGLVSAFYGMFQPQHRQYDERVSEVTS